VYSNCAYITESVQLNQIQFNTVVQLIATNSSLKILLMFIIIVIIVIIIIIIIINIFFFFFLLSRPTLVGKALSFTHELSFLFFFYQYTALSNHTVDGHQMYSGGSVVGKALTISIQISPTPP